MRMRPLRPERKQAQADFFISLNVHGCAQLVHDYQFKLSHCSSGCARCARRARSWRQLRRTGSWSPTGGPGAQRGASFYPFLFSLSKHAQREQRAQPLCRSDFFVHDVHDVHDARGYNGRAI